MTNPAPLLRHLSRTMKAIVLLALLALAFATHAADAPAAAAKDLRQLLQDGLFEEEANRDLEKAGAAYSALVEQYGEQRAFAATALFRLAEIRAKQGNKAEAIALHQRLLAEFPNHDPLAKLSRDRLAALGAAAPASSAPGDAVTEEEAKEIVRLQEMVKNSPDLVNANAGGVTPLSHAARNGWAKAATLLLEHGADVNGAPDSRPLVRAAREGHKRMVELLLERGADLNQKEWTGATALQAACERDRRQIADLLIEKGANPNIPAGPGGGSWLIGTALYAAVERGDLELFRKLLSHGADPNQGVPGTDQRTPFLLAARRSNPEVVRALLKHGANVNSVVDKGYTALHEAAVDAPEIVALLLEHGASPKTQAADGATPLHVSAGGAPPSSGGIRFADKSTEEQLKALHRIWAALLNAGADINARDQIGQTPLFAAARRATLALETVAWLVEHGADIRLKDNSGHTCFESVSGEQREAFDVRYVFPRFAQQRGVHVFLRLGSGSDEPATLAPAAPFDAPPSLVEALVHTMGGRRLQSRYDILVYRLVDGEHIRKVGQTRFEFSPNAARGELPKLQWGDVIVLRSDQTQGLGNFPQLSSDVLGVGGLSRTVENKRVTLHIGDRTQSVVLGGSRMKDSWDPTAETFPIWTFSELIARVAAIEPRVQLAAIKVQRTADGKEHEWIVDLRSDASGAVKELPARLADGDRVVIPLRAANDPEALNQRWSGIFRAAPGRVFGERVFERKHDDPVPRTLCEFIAESYAGSSMIVPHPDFSRITIHRLKGDSGEEEAIVVDLSEAIRKVRVQTPDTDERAHDVTLQWGDMIEIAHINGADPAAWTGFNLHTQLFLKKALRRTILSADKAPDVSLEPVLLVFKPVGSTWEASYSGGGGRVESDRRPFPFTLHGFMGKTGKTWDRVLRVKVRSGNQVRDIDLKQIKPEEVWLRDGDEIEIDQL